MEGRIKMKKFELKKEHILLLSDASISWNDSEFGAPGIYPKKPYGNSNVHQDMIKILGLKEIKEGVYEFVLFGEKWLLKGQDKYNIYLEGKDEDSLTDELDKLHKELEIALAIVLRTKSFKKGLYEADDYSSNWRLKK